MRNFLLTGFMMLSVLAGAQIDSVRVSLLGGDRIISEEKARFGFGFEFDARRSFVNSENVRFGGFRIPLHYRRVHRFGAGYYWLTDRVFDYSFPYDIDEEKVEYNLEYATLFYERVLYFREFWEISAGGSLGGGGVRVHYNPNGGNDRLLLERIDVNPLEIQLSGDYYIFNWIGLGAGIGYRQIAGGTEQVRDFLSGPIYIFKAQIDILQIIRNHINGKPQFER